MDSLLPGSALEMLVLEVIAQGPSYGYEIAQTVAGRSGGTFEMKEGSLYPALHRLERHKFLKSLWREADGRRRRYYELTDAGRAELASRKQSWHRFAAGIDGVLGSNRAGWAETT
ncbi:MAG: PadR family transcriptional regulator [Isosphaeraceae bacterium]|jgi:PadR family transcriptional regulator, regulatory protein PadR